MQRILLNEVSKLKQLPHVNQKTVNEALKRIKSNPRLIKKENVESHFCSFFIPIHKESKSIFLVHHIKADDWIPPGGHIEKDELPKQTVIREFKEELRHELTTEIIDCFDISIKDIADNPRNNCKMHYDLWHVVYVDKLDFIFDKGEFYDAGWFSFEEGIKKIKTTKYRKIIETLFKTIHLL
ncbi:MAG: NUDIX domain-containing protein [bacterium]|nr:NUDIX domain-containing protein [bacterium]